MRIIAGQRRGMKLAAPPGLQTRPVLDRIKQSWFDVIGTRVRGAKVVDMYSGVGSLGLEALSRDAESCAFIESAPECVRLLEQHLVRSTFVSRADVLTGSAPLSVKRLLAARRTFDLIFCDPPFAMATEPSFYAQDAPLDLVARLLAVDGMLMLRRERRKKEPYPELPASVRVLDERTWGKSEVIFMARAATGEGESA